MVISTGDSSWFSMLRCSKPICYNIKISKPYYKSYMCDILYKGHWWVMAVHALQGGCLPLHIETGLYQTPKIHFCVNYIQFQLTIVVTA